MVGVPWGCRVALARAVASRRNFAGSPGREGGREARDGGRDIQYRMAAVRRDSSSARLRCCLDVHELSAMILGRLLAVAALVGALLLMVRWGARVLAASPVAEPRHVVRYPRRVAVGMLLIAAIFGAALSAVAATRMSLAPKIVLGAIAGCLTAAALVLAVRALFERVSVTAEGIVWNFGRWRREITWDGLRTVHFRRGVVLELSSEDARIRVPVAMQNLPTLAKGLNERLGTAECDDLTRDLLLRLQHRSNARDHRQS